VHGVGVWRAIQTHHHHFHPTLIKMAAVTASCSMITARPAVRVQARKSFAGAKGARPPLRRAATAPHPIDKGRRETGRGDAGVLQQTGRRRYRLRGERRIGVRQFQLSSASAPRQSTQLATSAGAGERSAPVGSRQAGCTFALEPPAPSHDEP
jgi:hypothetical protein